MNALLWRAANSPMGVKLDYNGSKNNVGLISYDLRKDFPWFMEIEKKMGGNVCLTKFTIFQIKIKKWLEHMFNSNPNTLGRDITMEHLCGRF